MRIIQLSDKDYELLVDSLAALPSMLCGAALSTRQYNRLRRLRLLGAKLRRKQSTVNLRKS